MPPKAKAKKRPESFVVSEDSDEDASASKPRVSKRLAGNYGGGRGAKKGKFVMTPEIEAKLAEDPFYHPEDEDSDFQEESNSDDSGLSSDDERIAKFEDAPRRNKKRNARLAYEGAPSDDEQGDDGDGSDADEDEEADADAEKPERGVAKAKQKQEHKGKESGFDSLGDEDSSDAEEDGSMSEIQATPRQKQSKGLKESEVIDLTSESDDEGVEVAAATRKNPRLVQDAGSKHDPVKHPSSSSTAGPSSSGKKINLNDIMAKSPELKAQTGISKILFPNKKDEKSGKNIDGKPEKITTAYSTAKNSEDGSMTASKTSVVSETEVSKSGTGRNTSKSKSDNVHGYPSEKLDPRSKWYDPTAAARVKKDANREIRFRDDGSKYYWTDKGKRRKYVMKKVARQSWSISVPCNYYWKMPESYWYAQTNGDNNDSNEIKEKSSSDDKRNSAERDRKNGAQNVVMGNGDAKSSPDDAEVVIPQKGVVIQKKGGATAKSPKSVAVQGGVPHKIVIPQKGGVPAKMFVPSKTGMPQKGVVPVKSMPAKSSAISQVQNAGAGKGGAAHLFLDGATKGGNAAKRQNSADSGNSSASGEDSTRRRADFATRGEAPKTRKRRYEPRPMAALPEAVSVRQYIEKKYGGYYEMVETTTEDSDQLATSEDEEEDQFEAECRKAGLVFTSYMDEAQRERIKKGRAAKKREINNKRRKKMFEEAGAIAPMGRKTLDDKVEDIERRIQNDVFLVKPEEILAQKRNRKKAANDSEEEYYDADDAFIDDSELDAAHKNSTRNSVLQAQERTAEASREASTSVAQTGQSTREMERQRHRLEMERERRYERKRVASGDLGVGNTGVTGEGHKLHHYDADDESVNIFFPLRNVKIRNFKMRLPTDPFSEDEGQHGYKEYQRILQHGLELCVVGLNVSSMPKKQTELVNGVPRTTGVDSNIKILNIADFVPLSLLTSIYNAPSKSRSANSNSTDATVGIINTSEEEQALRDEEEGRIEEIERAREAAIAAAGLYLGPDGIVNDDEGHECVTLTEVDSERWSMIGSPGLKSLQEIREWLDEQIDKYEDVAELRQHLPVQLWNGNVCWRWEQAVVEDAEIAWGYASEYFHGDYPFIHERDDALWADLVFRLAKAKRKKVGTWQEFSANWVQASAEPQKVTIRTLRETSIKGIEGVVRDASSRNALKALKIYSERSENSNGLSTVAPMPSSDKDNPSEGLSSYLPFVMLFCHHMRNLWLGFRLALRINFGAQYGSLPERGKMKIWADSLQKSMFMNCCCSEWFSHMSVEVIDTAWFQMGLDYGPTWMANQNFDRGKDSQPEFPSNIEQLLKRKYGVKHGQIVGDLTAHTIGTSSMIASGANAAGSGPNQISNSTSKRIQPSKSGSSVPSNDNNLARSGAAGTGSTLDMKEIRARVEIMRQGAGGGPLAFSKLLEGKREALQESEAWLLSDRNQVLTGSLTLPLRLHFEFAPNISALLRDASSLDAQEVVLILDQRVERFQSLSDAALTAWSRLSPTEREPFKVLEAEGRINALHAGWHFWQVEVQVIEEHSTPRKEAAPAKDAGSSVSSGRKKVTRKLRLAMHIANCRRLGVVHPFTTQDNIPGPTLDTFERLNLTHPSVRKKEELMAETKPAALPKAAGAAGGPGAAGGKKLVSRPKASKPRLESFETEDKVVIRKVRDAPGLVGRSQDPMKSVNEAAANAEYKDKRPNASPPMGSPDSNVAEISKNLFLPRPSPRLNPQAAGVSTSLSVVNSSQIGGAFSAPVNQGFSALNAGLHADAKLVASQNSQQQPTDTIDASQFVASKIPMQLDLMASETTMVSALVGVQWDHDFTSLRHYRDERVTNFGQSYANRMSNNVDIVRVIGRTVIASTRRPGNQYDVEFLFDGTRRGSVRFTSFCDIPRYQVGSIVWVRMYSQEYGSYNVKGMVERVMGRKRNSEQLQRANFLRQEAARYPTAGNQEKIPSLVVENAIAGTPQDPYRDYLTQYVVLLENGRSETITHETMVGGVEGKCTLTRFVGHAPQHKMGNKTGNMFDKISAQKLKVGFACYRSQQNAAKPELVRADLASKEIRIKYQHAINAQWDNLIREDQDKYVEKAKVNAVGNASMVNSVGHATAMTRIAGNVSIGNPTAGVVGNQTVANFPMGNQTFTNFPGKVGQMPHAMGNVIGKGAQMQKPTCMQNGMVQNAMRSPAMSSQFAGLPVHQNNINPKFAGLPVHQSRPAPQNQCAGLPVYQARPAPQQQFAGLPVHQNRQQPMPQMMSHQMQQTQMQQAQRQQAQMQQLQQQQRMGQPQMMPHQMAQQQFQQQQIQSQQMMANQQQQMAMQKGMLSKAPLATPPRPS